MAKPGEYIGGVLKTLQSVPVLSASGAYKYTADPGEILGMIDSYIVKDGAVYWLLNDNRSVKHGTNLFDTNYLEKSLLLLKEQRQQLIDQAVKKRQAENTSVLYQTGTDIKSGISFITGNLKTIFIIAIAVILVAVFLRIKG